MIYLFLLWLPFMGIVGYCNVKLAPAVTWPFFVVAGGYVAVMVVISVLRFIAYFRWKDSK